MSDFKNLKIQSSNGIVRVTISRPEALNALNEQVLNELTLAFSHIGGTAEMRGVILTGEGKAFVAGADISGMKGMTLAQSDRFTQLGHGALRLIETMQVPVIAAVNGFALGGGLELALACDFIYAGQSAKFGLPEVSLGLFPGFGGTQRLPRLIGRNKAKEMIFCARVLGADEALAWGIVNRVVEDDKLLATAEETMQTILAKGPIAVRLAKRVINEGCDLPLESGLALERAQFPTTFFTEDCREGVSAFLEKRKANFKGV